MSPAPTLSTVLARRVSSDSARTAPVLTLAVACALGVVALSLLARVTIPLPWTPVPITGQTFGVTLLALVGGRTLAVGTVASYLALGWLGAPVFANGATFVTGASAGYLVGMLLASAVVGHLADRGWTRGFVRRLGAAYVGSACTFACGLLVLSQFVPAGALLGAGLWPFLIGDLVKNVAAAGLASAAARGA